MMDKYKAQGIADDVSRSVKCAAAAKIRELLALRGVELPPERMEALLKKLGDFAYSEIWRGLAGEEVQEDEKFEELTADILAAHTEFRKALRESDRNG